MPVDAFMYIHVHVHMVARCITCLHECLLFVCVCVQFYCPLSISKSWACLLSFRLHLVLTISMIYLKCGGGLRSIRRASVMKKVFLVFSPLVYPVLSFSSAFCVLLRDTWPLCVCVCVCLLKNN